MRITRHVRGSAAFILATLALPGLAPAYGQGSETYEVREITVKPPSARHYGHRVISEPPPAYLPETPGTFVEVPRGPRGELRHVLASGVLNLREDADGYQVLWIATLPGEKFTEARCWGRISGAEISIVNPRPDRPPTLPSQHAAWVEAVGIREIVGGHVRWRSVTLFVYPP